MSGGEEDGFLSRWSRRKRALERGEELAEPAPPEPEAPLPQEVAQAQEVACAVEPPAPAQPEFDPASLPPIETLEASSDFTPFLKAGVPSALRHAALRRAWTADPLIRDYMGSLDYGWDFNTPGGLPLGFSNTLAETGEALRKLISQAIGEIEPEEEKPPEPELEAAPPEASPTPLADPLMVENLPDEPLPVQPIRLSEAPVEPLPTPLEEPPPPARRRHGGALPV